MAGRILTGAVALLCAKAAMALDDPQTPLKDPLGSGNWSFGWYYTPLFPFLCIGAGDLIARLWRKPNLLLGTLFVVLLVFYTLNFTLDAQEAVNNAASWPATRRMVSLVLVGFMVPYALVQVWPHNRDCVRFARLATLAGLGTFVIASGYFVVHYDQIFESHHALDTIPFWTP